MSQLWDITRRFDVVIAGTGHRNIVKEDYGEIARCLHGELKTIAEQCGSAVVLTGLAQGADMLIADVATDVGLPYIGVLAYPLEQFRSSFDDKDALKKLDGYVERAFCTVIAQDVEQDFPNRRTICDYESYCYRQEGIELTRCCDILVALWDGKPPKSRYGCGTVEVVDFALNGHTCAPDVKRSVLWIKCRRQGDVQSNTTYRYITANAVSGADVAELCTSQTPQRYFCLSRFSPALLSARVN